MNIRTLVPLIIAVLILLGAVALYGAGYYLLTKFNETENGLDTQIAAKGRDLENASRAHAALSSQGGQTLDQYLLAKSDIVPFLEELQGEGAPFGAKVDVLSVTDQKDKVRSRVQLSLSITGSFDAVMRTLGSIEYSPYDGVMTNVSLGTATGDAKTATGTAWTALATYSVALAGTSTPAKKP